MPLEVTVIFNPDKRKVILHVENVALFLILWYFQQHCLSCLVFM